MNQKRRWIIDHSISVALYSSGGGGRGCGGCRVGWAVGTEAGLCCPAAPLAAAAAARLRSLTRRARASVVVSRQSEECSPEFPCWARQIH